MGEATKQVPVEGRGMPAFAAWPNGRGPFAAVLIAIHGPGLDRFIEDTCGRLASEGGYYAIAPDVYHRLHVPKDRDGKIAVKAWEKLIDRDIIADMNAAVEMLRREPLVDPERIGLMGFCMGGRVAYLMPAVNPAFKASVAYYGGNVGAARGSGPTVMERLKNLHCPVLGFFGEEDQNPSPADMRAIDAELTKRGKPHEFHSYPGAGHAYMDFTTPRYNEAAAKASWPITLRFLEERLKPLRAGVR